MKSSFSFTASFILFHSRRLFIMPKAFIPQLEKGPFEFINKKCSVSVETEKEEKKKKMKKVEGGKREEKKSIDSNGECK